MKKNSHFLTWCLGILLGLLGLFCGCGIQTGSSDSSPNDVAPTGTVIAQGTFTALNGTSPAAGTAVIYLSGTNYILRLEGISFPSESGLTARVNSINSGQVASVTLRAATGSQNLTISPPFQTQFSSVYIYSTLQSKNYASAFFTMI